jgi:FtsP/CotA-like multicopper oxidase with cupredoxin domain
MIRNLIIFSFCVFISSISFGAILKDTIHINKEAFQIGGSNGFTFQACVFNPTSIFEQTNKIIELNEGDILELHVINHDTLEHTFTIDNLVENNNVILAGQTKDFTLTFTEIGPYRYYSDVYYGKRLGASSIIMYGYDNYSKYYWNMFEQSDTLSEEIALLETNSIPFDYQPVIFTINMKVHPDLNNDPHAKINENVGDTIYISALNSGAMLHTLHFHGYHVEIINASINTMYNGWIKDSFPILEDEIVFIRLVPDQPGAYPVHEHNLINVTTNGVYPGGMLNLINIQP